MLREEPKGNRNISPRGKKKKNMQMQWPNIPSVEVGWNYDEQSKFLKMILS